MKRRPSTHIASKVLATSRNTAPVSFFSPKYLVTLSKRRASCIEVVFGSESQLLTTDYPRTLT
jgi:hypothetical protein